MHHNPEKAILETEILALRELEHDTSSKQRGAFVQQYHFLWEGIHAKNDFFINVYFLSKYYVQIQIEVEFKLFEKYLNFCNIKKMLFCSLKWNSSFPS